MTIKMTRVQGGEALRTTEVIGTADFPVVGKVFMLVSKSLDPNMEIRLITTSNVVEVEYLPKRKGLVAHTRTGSKYLLQLM